MPHALQQQFGNIDIYLFDQLLRARIRPDARIFDAGCGYGRNLVWFLRRGHDVSGVDNDAAAVEATRRLAAAIAPRIPAENFRNEPLEACSFEDASADLVIASAVLHFARDDAHFSAMLRGAWRILSAGGLFFCRLASNIGIERQVRPVAGRRHMLPDGSERYLVDESTLMWLTSELGGELADPLKTTVVQNQRAMTTWVLWKR